MLNFPEAILFNSIKRFYSRSGDAASLVVLTYHRVLEAPDPILNKEIDIKTFVWHMRLLKRYFNILPLDRAIHYLQQGGMPERAVCICFDDGYADNYTNALPVLKKYQIPATFFIAVGFLDGGRMWNDTVIESIRAATTDDVDFRNIGLHCYSISSPNEKQQAINSMIDKLKYLPHDERLSRIDRMRKMIGARLPSGLMMTTKQLRECCRESIEIGAHTVNHNILLHIPMQEAEQEISNSRRQLMESLNVDVKFFAYPNGKANLDYNRAHTAAVKQAGFAAAFTTEWGGAQSHNDVYQLPRIAPWDATPFRFAMRVLRTFKQNEFKCVK